MPFRSPNKKRLAKNHGYKPKTIFEQLAQSQIQKEKNKENSGKQHSYPQSAEMETGVIYMGKYFNQIKVGYTKNIENRQRAYDRNYGKIKIIPVVSIKNNDLEKAEHKVLEELKIHYEINNGREWFRTSDLNIVRELIIKAANQWTIKIIEE